MTGSQILASLLKWTPLLADGFLWNLAIGATAMALGTLLGFALGMALLATRSAIRAPAWLVTQVLRNSPWLVLLFYVMYLTPFTITLFGMPVRIPGWLKAAFGFTLPVTGYIAEIARGGVTSIPLAQWESAGSLGFSRWKSMTMIILPQSIKRMVPPWMNLYASVTMATVLANVVGVTEALTVTQHALQAEARPELLLPMYGYVLLWFLVYCSLLSWGTRRVERRWAVERTSAA